MLAITGRLPTLAVMAYVWACRLTAALVVGIAVGAAACETRPEPAVMPPSSGSSIDLSQFRAKNRVLLLFAPVMGDERSIRQRNTLKTHGDGVIERDLVRVDVHGDEVNRRFLREQFGVPVEQFTVVLIGKDGTEKLRRSEPIDADELFGIIDAMPMRQGEMKQ